MAAAHTAKVFRRKLISRTTFRKLPFGAAFWTAATLGTAPPYLKLGRRGIVTTRGTDAVVQGDVLDTSIAVVRLDSAFLPYAGAAIQIL